ncbi:MAG: ComEC/Rec2 family competence protein [Alphaproteobacteria bacterium]|nr:ComEC/Rec2 family competence protein [Alphaproteobacteria bacterium]
MNPLSVLARNFQAERARWSYWLPVAVAGGVVLYFVLPFEPPVFVLGLPVILGAGAWLLKERSWPLALAFFALMLVSLGFAASKTETLLDARPMLDAPQEFIPITGRVLGIDIMPDSLRIVLLHPTLGDLPEEKRPERIRVKFNDLSFDEAPPIGSAIAFKGTVYPFSGPAAPDAADFRRYAFYKHLGGLGWSRDTIKVTDSSPNDYSLGERFNLMLERARKTLARHVYERLSGDVAAITAARLNGEQTAISQPVMDAMRTSGLAHLLATSGANVTIMGLLIYFPLRMLLALSPWLTLRFPIKKWAAMAAILSALAFTFLVGSQAATMRSMLMVGLAMIAIALDRNTHPLYLVMLSALLSMLFVPSATMGASFQMSFAAVFCLVATTRSLDWAFGKNVAAYIPSGLRASFGYVGGIMRASLIAIAAVTPFSIYHFHTFNLYGFLSNALAIPLTSFWVMPFTVLAYATAPWNMDGFFIDMAGLGNAATIRIAETVAAWPRSILYWPAMPGFVLAGITLGGLWLCLWRRSWRFWGLVPVILGMLYPLYTPRPSFFAAPDGNTWGAVLDDGRLAVPNAKKQRFILDQWRERLGNVPLVDAKALPSDHPQVSCDAMGCLYRHGAFAIAMPAQENAAIDDCLNADLVVAPFPIAGCNARVLDATDFATHGAHALFFKNGKPDIAYAYERPGLRPWSVGWHE